MPDFSKLFSKPIFLNFSAVVLVKKRCVLPKVCNQNFNFVSFSIFLISFLIFFIVFNFFFNFFASFFCAVKAAMRPPSSNPKKLFQ